MPLFFAYEGCDCLCGWAHHTHRVPAHTHKKTMIVAWRRKHVCPATQGEGEGGREIEDGMDWLVAVFLNPVVGAGMLTFLIFFRSQVEL